MTEGSTWRPQDENGATAPGSGHYQGGAASWVAPGPLQAPTSQPYVLPATGTTVFIALALLSTFCSTHNSLLAKPQPFLTEQQLAGLLGHVLSMHTIAIVQPSAGRDPRVGGRSSEWPLPKISQDISSSSSLEDDSFSLARICPLSLNK